MSVKRLKNSKIYYTNFSHHGQRIRRSTGTTDKSLAQKYEDTLKDRLWRQQQLGQSFDYTWPEAAHRFIQESTKAIKGQKDDCHKVLWLTQQLGDMRLKSITLASIQKLMQNLRETNKTPATINRYLAVLRAVLNKAAREWIDEISNEYWLDKVPTIKILKEPKRRIRFLSHEEAQKLIQITPSHLSDLIAFSLATGLRQANVLFLEWSQIDEVKQHAWIHSDQAKAKKPIAVPLNRTAMTIINRCKGRHAARVFTFKGRPINTIESRTWKKYLKKAGIQDFRWHDLRHTWASWHVQAGTPLQVLMELGGWSSMEMVLKYAHLSGQHLKNAATNVEVVFKDLGHKIGTGEIEV